MMTFKGTRRSLPDIAKQLGADAVVEGSVAKLGQRVRITAQLIHASDDKLWWSQTYEREFGDILQMQADIASDIASQIRKVVNPVVVQGTSQRRVNPQAYEARAKGNYFRDKMTPPDLIRSIELFEEAIQIDPLYAQTFGDLSQSYFFCDLFGVGPAEEMFRKARSNAEWAIHLEETIAIAHVSLAAVHVFHDWDWPRAEAECRRAVELSPGEPVAHAHFADYMSIRGRHDEAIQEFRRVLELDSISRVYLGHFALLLYRARNYKESIVYCRKALEMDPQYANAMWFLALSLEATGQLWEAVSTLEHASRISAAPHYRALLGRAYALTGETAKAGAILDELMELSRKRYVSPLDIAVVYVGLGDHTLTFHHLEEAYRQRVFRLIELTLPMFDALRPDPRWQNLVARIGLVNLLTDPL